MYKNVFVFNFDSFYFKFLEINQIISFSFSTDTVWEIAAEVGIFMKSKCFTFSNLFYTTLYSLVPGSDPGTTILKYKNVHYFR